MERQRPARFLFKNCNEFMNCRPPRGNQSQRRFLPSVLYIHDDSSVLNRRFFCFKMMMFADGHTITHNLLFNWVRETQDHGPINTWNRAAFVARNGTSGQPTLIPPWTVITQNMIMNGPSGNRDLGNLFPGPCLLRCAFISSGSATLSAEAATRGTYF